MSYVALYRKYRPLTFDDVRGQEHIVTTLRNQIRTGRIGHAYLFVGTRGTGKTTIAKIFARAVNCENPQNGSPCGECAVCRAIASGAALNVVELDAASNNGVDEVRQIIEEIDYSPTIGRYRVYIVDEVHMFTAAAFNALLKTLEEPPAHVIFLLATTEMQKIPVTILSRCQRYDFHRISLDEITDRLRQVSLAEGIDATDDALSFVARAADGALRDGLSLLDQCAAFYYGQQLTRNMVLDMLGAVETEVYGRLFCALQDGNVTDALDRIAEAVADGRDLMQYVNDFIWYLRNLMLIKAAGDGSHLTDVSTENLAEMEKVAAGTDLDTLLRDIRIFSELSAQIRYSAQKRVLIEMAVIRLLHPRTEKENQDLAARVSILEQQSEKTGRQLQAVVKKLESGGYVTAAAPGGQAAAGDAGGEAQAARVRELAKALPEEIRELIRNKNRIFAGLKQPLRDFMERSELYVDENGSLAIVSGLDIATLVSPNDHEHERVLKQAIEEAIGKSVDLRFLCAGDGGADAERMVPAEDILQAGIQFPVEIEEEEEEQ